MDEMMKKMQEVVVDYNNSEEGKQILGEVKEAMLKRAQSMRKLSTTVNNFVDSEKFKSFWKDREKCSANELIEIMDGFLGKELIDTLKAVSSNHLKLNTKLVEYAEISFSKILEVTGILLFNDCMKELQLEGKDDFFSIFLDRLEGVCKNLGEFAIDICRHDIIQSDTENATVH